MTDTDAIEAAAKALAADRGLDLDNLAAHADPGDTAADLAAWRANFLDDGRIAIEAAEPILRQAVIEELARTTGLAVRAQLREILAFHNAEFLAEHQIDERTQQIIDLLVPAARLQERPRVVEQFRAALLTGLDDLQRDEHRRVSPGDVADLIERVALEVGRGTDPR